ncbi:muscarinic acetylcholine receptor M1-like isoform X2 [Stylophora pistillata]|nr:muscarinic acetylcholine receptor M1-like isoform X2 [Stylophora pistillata]
MTSLQTIGWSLAFSLIAFIIVSGNVLTLVAFCGCKKLMQMRTSYFLLNLAAADLLVGAVTVPMYVILLSHHIDNVTYQSIYTAVDIASGFASVFTLTAIGLERLYAFCRPPHRVHVLSDLKCLSMIAIVWISSFVVTILHLLYKFQFVSFDVFFYVMMSSLSACLLVICASYLGIWIRVKFYFTTHSRASGSDKKVARMLLTITLTFVVTWLPFHLLNIINFFCNFCLKAKLPHNALFFCKLLHYANSFLNPIIYSFQMPEFRIALGRKLCKEAFAVVEETPKIEEIPLDNIGGAEELRS